MGGSAVVRGNGALAELDLGSLRRTGFAHSGGGGLLVGGNAALTVTGTKLHLQLELRLPEFPSRHADGH